MPMLSNGRGSVRGQLKLQSSAKPEYTQHTHRVLSIAVCWIADDSDAAVGNIGAATKMVDQLMR